MRSPRRSRPAEQEGHRLTIAENFEKMDKVIDEKLDPASRSDRTAILGLVALSRRREALMNLEAEIAEVGLWLANYTRVRKPEYHTWPVGSPTPRSRCQDRPTWREWPRMKSVNIAELKNRLSAYLAEVRRGTEILVRDRHTPVARIIPLTREAGEDDELQVLAASGALRLGQGVVGNDFWRLPAPRVSTAALKRALDDERADDAH